MNGANYVKTKVEVSSVEMFCFCLFSNSETKESVCHF